MARTRSSPAATSSAALWRAPPPYDHGRTGSAHVDQLFTESLCQILNDGSRSRWQMLDSFRVLWNNYNRAGCSVLSIDDHIRYLVPEAMGEKLESIVMEDIGHRTAMHIRALRKTHWALESSTLYAVFGDDAMKSRRFMASLRDLEDQEHDFDKALGILKQWAAKRRSGDLRLPGVDQDTLWQPWDSEQAIRECGPRVEDRNRRGGHKQGLSGEKAAGYQMTRKKSNACHITGTGGDTTRKNDDDGTVENVAEENVAEENGTEEGGAERDGAEKNEAGRNEAHESTEPRSPEKDADARGRQLHGISAYRKEGDGARDGSDSTHGGAAEGAVAGKDLDNATSPRTSRSRPSPRQASGHQDTNYLGLEAASTSLSPPSIKKARGCGKLGPTLTNSPGSDDDIDSHDYDSLDDDFLSTHEYFDSPLSAPPGTPRPASRAHPSKPPEHQLQSADTTLLADWHHLPAVQKQSTRLDLISAEMSKRCAPDQSPFTPRQKLKHDQPEHDVLQSWFHILGAAALYAPTAAHQPSDERDYILPTFLNMHDEESRFFAVKCAGLSAWWAATLNCDTGDISFTSSSSAVLPVPDRLALQLRRDHAPNAVQDPPPETTIDPCAWSVVDEDSSALVAYHAFQSVLGKRGASSKDFVPDLWHAILVASHGDATAAAMLHIRQPPAIFATETGTSPTSPSNSELRELDELKSRARKLAEWAHEADRVRRLLEQDGQTDIPHMDTTKLQDRLSSLHGILGGFAPRDSAGQREKIEELLSETEQALAKANSAHKMSALRINVRMAILHVKETYSDWRDECRQKISQRKEEIKASHQQAIKDVDRLHSSDEDRNGS